jgi:ubiquinone/menaquinone biosynthesis C-methylase UbiE
MSGRYQDWTESAEAWIADHGDEGDSSRRLILDPALRNLLGEVSGLRVLDVGCGHGRYTGHLVKRGAEAVGIEPAIPLLRHAHATYGPRFARADALALPFQDGSFDIVLSYLTLLDIEDHEGASREMVRVCRDGGRIVIVMISNLASTSDRWVKDAEGNRLYRTVDNYMDEFSMRVEWRGISIENFHRPLSSLFRPYFEAGLSMIDFLEPLPEPTSTGYDDERRCPTFQIYVFQKGPASTSPPVSS